MADKAANTTRPTDRCTPLQRRLASGCCFLYTLIANALLGYFIDTYVPGRPYLIVVVIGARIAVGISWARLHRYLTGDNRIDPLVRFAVGYLPTVLVDLELILLGKALSRFQFYILGGSGVLQARNPWMPF
jgi:hypothetical protein